MSLLLTSSIALVTGASRGIGYATALALARNGAHVVATARTVGGLEELDDAIKAAGGTTTLVPLDLRDHDGIARLAAALGERYRKLDIFIGNAGIGGPSSPLDHVQPKEWDEIIAINVLQSPEQTSQGFDIVQNKMKEEDRIRFFEHPMQFVAIRISRMVSRMFYANISDIIVRTLQATEYVIAVQSAKQANVVIHPNLVGINWFELDKVDELIDRGMEATRQHLDQIKKMVEAH